MNKIREFKKKLENNIFLKITKMIVYIVICLLLFVIIVQRFSNNSVSVGGIRIFTVASGSMVPEYNIGDILVSKKVDAENIDIGDNVTYMGEKGALKGLIITHKVIKKETKDNNTCYITKGVANSVADPEIIYDQIFGKVIYKSTLLSMFGKLLNNKIIYYLVFMLVAVVISIEVISSMFTKDDGDGRE